MTASAHHVDRIRGEAAMAATTVHTTCRNQQLWKQFRNLPVACGEMLDAFVSSRMQQAVSAAEHVRPQQFEDPHGSRFDVPPSDQAGAPAVRFGPLDPNVINDSIPAFFIGRNLDGLWVAREARGRIGGLFMLKSSAVSFAREQSGPSGCATIFPTERFELDLRNEGNLLASYLAPLLRLRSVFPGMIRSWLSSARQIVTLISGRG
jgi:hypothetical protein